MARKSEHDEALANYVKEHNIKTLEDVHAAVKSLTKDLIQQALDAELEEELGYSKYDYKNKKTTNSRNGSY